MQDPIEKRLQDEYRQVPKWAEDFPIDQNRDSNVSRRDFIRYLGLVSLGFFAGSFGMWIKSLFKSEQVHNYKRMKIIDKEDLKIGESYVFEIPNLPYQ